jgi:hypothetical protein
MVAMSFPLGSINDRVVIKRSAVESKAAVSREKISS